MNDHPLYRHLRRIGRAEGGRAQQWTRWRVVQQFRESGTEADRHSAQEAFVEAWKGRTESQRAKARRFYRRLEDRTRG